MKKYAVIVAGGVGERMGAGVPKQFLLLGEKSLLWHSVNAFIAGYPDMHIIVVLPGQHIDMGKNLLADLHTGHPILFAPGGSTRFHSVQNGLKFITGEAVIFVHDAVRCLVSKDLIMRCYEQAMDKGSAVPAVAATDSIRIVDGDTHRIADRKFVRIIQTPQTFISHLLLPAFAAAFHESFTDEATVVEAAGNNIFLVEGEYDNIKITRPSDMIIAESILQQRKLAVK